MSETNTAQSEQIGVESIFRDNNSITEHLLEGKLTGDQIRRIVIFAILGCAAYGFAIGIWRSPLQAVSAAIKLPVLFACALGITLPAFHFIGLHAGSKLQFKQTLSIIVSGMAVTGILMASFTPISLFFLVSDSSYEFLILLHFFVIGFCSFGGIMTIQRSIKHIAKTRGEQFTEGAETCMIAWFFLFAFVGMQLAWLMRPWIGSAEDFAFLRGAGGNFYVAIMKTLSGVLFS